MYPTPIENKRFGVLNGTQVDTLTIFAQHFGVRLDELRSLRGRELNAMCFKLACKYTSYLRNHFITENVGDIARAYKALANGGSI